MPSVSQNLNQVTQTFPAAILRKNGDTKGFQTVTQIKCIEGSNAFTIALQGNQRFVMDVRDPSQKYVLKIGQTIHQIDLKNIIPKSDQETEEFAVRLVVDTTRLVSGQYSMQGFKVDWKYNNTGSEFYRCKNTLLQLENDEYRRDATKVKQTRGPTSDGWGNNYLNNYRVRPEVVKSRLQALVHQQSFPMDYQPIVDAKQAPQEQRPQKPNPRIATADDWKQYADAAKYFALKKVKPCVIGAEALLPKVQTKPGDAHYFPDEIVQSAETDPVLVKALGRRVIESVANQIAQWNTRLSQDTQFAVNVNLSASQLEADTGLIEFIDTIIQEKNLRPSQLQFELTEEPAFNPTARNIAIMRSLHELGCRLHLTIWVQPQQTALQKLTLRMLIDFRLK